MNRVVLLSLASTLAACQPSSPAALSLDDVAAIRTATDRYVQAARAADWDAWAGLCTDSAVFLPPNGVALGGRQAIRQWGTAFTGIVSFASTVLEVKGRGDLAVSRGVYDFIMGPQAATQFADTGKFVTVWRREPDGEWRISHSIWNSTRPAAAPLATPAH